MIYQEKNERKEAVLKAARLSSQECFWLQPDEQAA